MLRVMLVSASIFGLLTVGGCSSSESSTGGGHGGKSPGSGSADTAAGSSGTCPATGFPCCVATGASTADTYSCPDQAAALKCAGATDGQKIAQCMAQCGSDATCQLGCTKGDPSDCSKVSSDMSTAEACCKAGSGNAGKKDGGGTTSSCMTATPCNDSTDCGTMRLGCNAAQHLCFHTDGECKGQPCDDSNDCPFRETCNSATMTCN